MFVNFKKFGELQRNLGLDAKLQQELGDELVEGAFSLDDKHRNVYIKALAVVQATPEIQLVETAAKPIAGKYNAVFVELLPAAALLGVVCTTNVLKAGEVPTIALNGTEETLAATTAKLNELPWIIKLSAIKGKR